MQYKLKAGKYMVPVDITDLGDKLRLVFPFNRELLEEVKVNFTNPRWLGVDGGPKAWEVNNDERAKFRLEVLQCKNPYTDYDKTLVDWAPQRSLFDHQVMMVRHALTRHYCIFACEMGTGKTLAAIELLESSGFQDWWYIGPKSALAAVQLEFWKWKAKITPRFLTYENLVKELRNWQPGMPAPQGVVFDESSRIKTPTAQRSQAAFALAAGVRKDWKHEGYAVLMSGSPAPKSPVDWWHQCETARPGFLKEGSHKKAKERLAFMQQQEGSDGVQFMKEIGWRDDENKCLTCSKLENEFVHTSEAVEMGVGHAFKKSVNEVAGLKKRMDGLVFVKFKKDCLDLPPKIYKEIKLKSDIQTLNAAKLIKATTPRAAEALIRLRELSDGFQYVEQRDGDELCPRCQGEKQDPICHACDGKGTLPKYKTVTVETPTPKDAALLDLLDEHEEFGRLVVFAGFTASVDRIVRLSQGAGWTTIRVDGRGWNSILGGSNTDLLRYFQEENGPHDKIVFIGHPQAAGMGLTLTASPSIVYWSNDFNAEARIQSEDRIHRPGCKGANIIDLIHLPTDKLVLDNLKAKRDLQKMTMADINKSLEEE